MATKSEELCHLVIRVFRKTKPLKMKWCTSVHDKRNCQNLVKSAYQSDECCVVLQEAIDKKMSLSSLTRESTKLGKASVRSILSSACGTLFALVKPPTRLVRLGLSVLLEVLVWSRKQDENCVLTTTTVTSREHQSLERVCEPTFADVHTRCQ